jgi:hypothetical protein
MRSMIKTIVYLLILFPSNLILKAQNQWSLHGGGSGSDQAYQVVATSDGGYLLAGQSDSYGAGGADIYVMKMSSSGQLQWTKTVGGTGNDVGRSAVQTPDGGYAIAGWTNSFGNGGDDMYLIKLDGAGNLLWAKTYGGSGNDRAWSLINDMDGGLVLCGQTSSFGASPNQFYLVKTDSQGNLLWDRRSGVSGVANIGYAVVQAADSGYVMAGSSYFWSGTASTSSTQVYAVKLDKQGSQVWASRIHNPRDDDARSIIATSDGGFVLAGKKYIESESTWDMYLLKLSATGQLLWDVSYGMSNSEEGYSVVELPDGSLIATGVILPSAPIANTWYDLYAVKFSSTGVPLWNRMFNTTLYGSGGSSSNLADYNVGRSIILTPDGGYAIAGFLGAGNSGAGHDEFFFLKFGEQDASCWPWQSGGSSKPGNATVQSAGTTLSAGGTSQTAGVEGNGGSVTFLCSVLPLSLQASSTSSCSTPCNGTAVATPSGGNAPFSYVWSPSGGNSDTATGLCPGSYSVLITDANGDTASTSVLINTISIDATVSASSDSTTFTANYQSSNATYQWVRCPDYIGNMGNSSTYSPTSSGSFALIVSEDGCSDTSECITYSPQLIINTPNSDFIFNLYPNPVINNVIIKTTAYDKPTTIRMLDLAGRQVNQWTLSPNQTELNLHLTEPRGIYFMELNGPNGKLKIPFIKIEE